MPIEFAEAGHADDAAIRRLVAGNPMPGAVMVAFEREPDYFAGLGVMGDRAATIKAVDTEGDRLAAIVSLASSERFVNGRFMPVGYIGGARVDGEFEGRLLPLRAAAYLRNRVTATPGWPQLWFTAIVDDNPAASAIFVTRPRPSIPPLNRVSEFVTLGLYTRALRRSRRHSPRVTVRRASEVGFAPIVRFLAEAGGRREFFPRYREEHLSGGARTPGLAAEDILVAVRGETVVATCGVWNQSSFKQTVVHGYQGWLRRTRPLYNAVAPLTGAGRLPEIGAEIRSAYLTFPCVRDDDPETFATLLDSALAAAHAQGCQYLLAGFSARDPLLPVARRFRNVPYRSTMYAFTFDGTDTSALYDEERVPYLEIAAL